jgi:hypothetical protein
VQIHTDEYIFLRGPTANMYSESREEARDFARVRNACFEQVSIFIVVSDAWLYILRVHICMPSVDIRSKGIFFDRKGILY